jgi:hypothetical protein
MRQQLGDSAGGLRPEPLQHVAQVADALAQRV